LTTLGCHWTRPDTKGKSNPQKSREMKKLHREHPEIYENFYKSMKGQTHTKEVKEIIRQSKIGSELPPIKMSGF
jgi:hypothetical protein